MKDAVLALELSTVHGSVAVVAGEQVLYEASFEARRSHNAQLFGPLGDALKTVGQRLRGIVVGTGPGSYTGVRIAIAAAQGVGLSRQVPVLGMCSLLGCVNESHFGVVGDARRGRFYVAQVRDGVLQAGIELVKPECLEGVMAEAGLPYWITCDEQATLPHLVSITPVASRLAAKGCRMDWGAGQDVSLEPIYLEGAFITQARKR
jgi:tRNA threonylcarbamoyl adenosine modification protein YeaZ